MYKKLKILLIIFIVTILHTGLLTVQKVHAERDDEDFENEVDDSDRRENRTIGVTTTVTSEPIQQTQQIVTDPAYTTDTDGDGLVDAIDPNPTIPQPAFFSDSDGDTIPDAFDAHPGEDDLSFVQDIDKNGNGILDSFEPQQ